MALIELSVDVKCIVFYNWFSLFFIQKCFDKIDGKRNDRMSI